MNNIDLGDINFDNVAEWPPLVKGVIMWAVVFVLLALGYFLTFKSQLEELQSLRKKEAEHISQMSSKQQQAVNLPLYREQLKNMQIKFGVLLKQLPAKTEIPELLEEISRTGIRDGLKFNLFDPQPEVLHDFYVEVPIKIAVDGTYSQMAHFISDIANMKRIVTLHDFDLQFPTESDLRKKPRRKINGRWPLLMNLTAKIYRYKSFSAGK